MRERRARLAVDPVEPTDTPPAGSQPGGRCLIVRPRFGAPRRFPLGDRLVTIGRAQNADIVLADPIVSSVHARVEPLAGGGHRVVDCHSRNGTRLNDAPLSEQDLRPGDRLLIGSTVLLYTDGDAPLDLAPDESRRGRPARPTQLGTLVDDDTSTLAVAPDDFDIDFLEPRTIEDERPGEVSLERRLRGLYRAAKTLTPIADRLPVEPRFVKLVQDVIGAPRAALVRVGPLAGEAGLPHSSTPPGGIRAEPARIEFEVLHSEVRAPAEPFSRLPPVEGVLRETRRTGRSLLFGRAAAQGVEAVDRVGSAIAVPVAEDGPSLLIAYADVPAGWAALTADDLRLLGVLARHAAACIANQRMHDALARANRELEARVLERTRELVESHRRLSVLAGVVTHAAEAIFTVGADGRITSWNRAAEQIFGYPGGEVEGRPALEAVAGPEERERLAELMSRARTSGAPALGEVALRSRDGRRVDGEAAFAPIFLESGAPTGELSAIVRDVTRGRRLEQEMLQNAKLAAVGTLAAGTAHEINNVLAVIMGNAELMQQSPDVASEHQENLAVILDAARRSRDVVRHLLTFARRRGPKREEANLVELLEATLRLLANDLARSGVRVRRSLAAIPPVPCDPGQISLVILSLVKNARDAIAAKGGGEMLVAIRRRHPETQGARPHAVLEVRDSGPGMTLEVQRRVFEPFFTTKEVGVGTGLGLSTAYGIVMNHGGRIEFESEPGKGTSFRVILPIERADVDEEAPGEAPEAPAEGAAGRTQPALHVLVCDDDPGIRATIAAMVRRLGHHATLVSRGEEALLAIGAARVDVVFLDQGMAGMDGVTTRAEILSRHPEQRVVLVTGNADIEELAARHGLTADQFLRKPFTYKEIAERLVRISGGEKA